MKKLFLLTIALIMTFSLACPVYAMDDGDGYLIENDLPASEGFYDIDGISTYASDSVGLVFKKTASTKAKAQVVALRGNATYVKSTINVQIKNGSTYNTITNGTATKSVYDDNINHVATFSISSRKTYRMKVTVTYKQNGVTYSDIYYTSLDSNGY